MAVVASKLEACCAARTVWHSLASPRRSSQNDRPLLRDSRCLLRVARSRCNTTEVRVDSHPVHSGLPQEVPVPEQLSAAYCSEAGCSCCNAVSGPCQTSAFRDAVSRGISRAAAGCNRHTDMCQKACGLSGKLTARWLMVAARCCSVSRDTAWPLHTLRRPDVGSRKC